MDYSGKWVLPQDFVSIAYYFDDYFRVEYSNLAQNIINSRGEKQFDKDYKHIVATGLGLHKRFQIECISKDNLSSLADTNFIFTYKDSLTRILSFVELKDRSKVHFYVNDGELIITMMTKRVFGMAKENKSYQENSTEYKNSTLQKRIIIL
ncbi:MAG: hypothetical protein IPK25_10180 [Saprospiraceae bacterium]|nr:hypothetical protein [Saprospiraceae bacterium]